MAEKTILVVDDHILARKGVNLILENFFSGLTFDLKSRVTEATSAEEALLLMTHTDFEIIISDVSMPGGMNGFEFLKEIKRLDGKFLETRSFIIMSAYSANPYYTEAQSLGATFVQKDDMDSFKEALQKAIEKVPF